LTIKYFNNGQTYFNNAGSTFTLPKAIPGLSFTFKKVSNNTVHIDPASGDTITGGLVNAKLYMRNVNSSVVLKCMSVGKWTIDRFYGDFYFDSPDVFIYGIPNKLTVEDTTSSTSSSTGALTLPGIGMGKGSMFLDSNVTTNKLKIGAGNLLQSIKISSDTLYIKRSDTTYFIKMAH
jgi:hypothetical protein